MADSLVEAFQPDALFKVSGDPTVAHFVARYPHLMWPVFPHDLFSSSIIGGMASTFVDATSAAQYVAEIARRTLLRLECSTSDPLADLFLAMFGGYPSPEAIGVDYVTELRKHVLVHEGTLPHGSPFPRRGEMLTPFILCREGLEVQRVPGSGGVGLYVGDAEDFDDLTHFHNLRASGAQLAFYDHRFRGRLADLRAWFVEVSGDARSREPWSRFLIWRRPGYRGEEDAELFENATIVNMKEDWAERRRLGPDVWWSEQSVLGIVTSTMRGPMLSIPLPQAEVLGGTGFFHTHAVSLRTWGDFGDSSEHTFYAPFIPELNEFYGREHYFRWNMVRAEHDGVAVITNVGARDLVLNAIGVPELFAKIFSVFGVEARPSHAGRVADRLIRQMGGIQACRVFKVGGVRDLIAKCGPSKSFTRTAAIDLISKRDPVTGQIAFSEYEALYIESRERRNLTPDDVWAFLLKRGLFRAGLELTCTHCEFASWLPIDSIRERVSCEMCGGEYHVTPQLRDRDWRFRRSGIMGLASESVGAVAVALTLQQLATVSSYGHSLFATGFELSSGLKPLENCETDFVFLTSTMNGRLEIAVGECKTNMEVVEDDVAKMAAVADALPAHRFDVYVVFAKAGSFSPKEASRCDKANRTNRRRVILLSGRELEPYFVYERSEAQLGGRTAVTGLEGLVRGTDVLYFQRPSGDDGYGGRDRESNG